MQQRYLLYLSPAVRRALLVLLFLSLPTLHPAQAQENCLLVPVPLAERLRRASWVLEAQAEAAHVVPDAQGHLLTRYELTVYKVFRGPEAEASTLPTTLLLPGGTLGNRREDVSNTPQLRPGQQGVFFLEADPQHPGEWRLFAGPQGFIGYNVGDRTAAEPFGTYPDIATSLYAVLRDPAQALGYRRVQANTALTAPRAMRRAGAVAAVGPITFAPTTITAGSGAVLTITGSGFGATRGTGTVQFRNADNGGNTRVSPYPSDYISWTDTEIRVRVPSFTPTPGPAGTGTVLVTNSANETSTSAATLTVTYALINVLGQGSTTPSRPRLRNDDAQGGYTLQYSPSFTDATRAGAPASFQRALATWACATRLRRAVSATAGPEATTGDGVNVVRFGNAVEVPTGVLGVATSYYTGCGPAGGPVAFSLVETDYTFNSSTDWQFGPEEATGTQYDFETVALHELGHGTQLTHLIDEAAVMHFAIANGENKRTLDTDSDMTGGTDVFTFSTSNVACGNQPPVATAVPADCGPLPVELTQFAARYEAGRGSLLTWTTASERNSAYFGLEARDEGATAWLELRRLPAAGHSSNLRRYEFRDPRLLSGIRYYRLRQADADGKISFSPVVAVSADEPGLALYPNPVTDWLEVSGPPARAGQLRFYDLTARKVAQFDLVSGPNRVDISQLRAGLYQVEWTAGQTLRRGRVQKL